MAHQSRYSVVPLLLLLLAFPVSLPLTGGSYDLYVTSGAYIGSAAALVLLYSSRMGLPRILKPLWVLLLLTIAYICLHILITTLIGVTGNSFQDLNELIRILGVLSFIFLGALINKRLTPQGAKLTLIIIGLLLSYLLLAWQFDALRTPIFDFYITRYGRFSGLGFAVNYVWAHVLVLFGLFAYVWSSERKAGLIFAIWFISLLLMYAILSGSRTSMLVLVLPVTFLLYAFNRPKLTHSIFLFFSLAVAIFFIQSFFSDPVGGMFERPGERVNELVDAYEKQDIERIPALESRVSEFYRRTEVILESPFFGHGLNRATEPFFHSSYQLTMYRYGILGLFFELCLYLTASTLFLRGKDDHPFRLITAAFLLAYIPAGFVSLVWYELRTPYLLAALVGAAGVIRWGRESREEQRVGPEQSATL